MKRIRNLFMGLFPAVVIRVGFASYQKYDRESGRELGGGIRFGASTGYMNGSSTKTKYSGMDEKGSSISSISKWERIDWVSNSDMIRRMRGIIPVFYLFVVVMIIYK